MRAPRFLPTKREGEYEIAAAQCNGCGVVSAQGFARAALRRLNGAERVAFVVRMEKELAAYPCKCEPLVEPRAYRVGMILCGTCHNLAPQCRCPEQGPPLEIVSVNRKAGKYSTRPMALEHEGTIQ